MSVKQIHTGSPFLIDETGDIVGVRSSDGTVAYFAFLIPTATTPVDGVQSTLTTDMTNSDADITLTAVDYGTGGNRISVTYVDPNGNDKALTVSVSGFAITVSLATDETGEITSIAEDVVDAINAAAGDLVTATYEGDGSGVVEAVAEDFLSGGVNVTAGPVGTIAFDTNAENIYIKAGEQVWKKFSRSLAGMSDVLIVEPEDGDVLTYSETSGKWENVSPS